MTKFFPASVAGVILACSTAPAFASFGLFCEGEGVEIEIPMGGGVGLRPLSATIEAADKIWTTEQSAAAHIQIVPAQSVAVDNRLYIDFSDPEASTTLVQIRLFWAEEETDPVYGGVIRIADHGVWAISCGMG